MEKIRAKNLTFSYYNSDDIALNNLNFTINDGEYIALCGKSGCGKSTLLKNLKKHLIPGGIKLGDVEIDGIRVEDMEDFKSVSKVGYIFQNPEAQIVTDKVWHELAFGLENLGLSNDVIKRRVAEMTNYFGISQWFHKDTDSLSGGEKQILNLASIMVMQPEILLLDEPTSQLDPIKSKEFLHMVDRLNKEFGITVIISEHNLGDVLPCCDRLMIMDSGEILHFENPKSAIYNLLDKDKVNDTVNFFPNIVRIFENEYKKFNNVNDYPINVNEGRLAVKCLVDKEEIDESKYDDAEKSGKQVSSPDKTSDDYAIICQNLWFKYSKNEEFVLRGTNLNVRKGKIYTILGGNGAGKSTLMKSILNITKVQRGKISIKENLEIGFVPQNPKAIFTETTVAMELFTALDNYKLSEDEKLDKIENMMRLMEITHLQDKNPYDLSGGEEQRLAIGKILLLDRDIIFLDEPTKAIDNFFKNKLGELLKTMTFMGKTIVVVSHDIEFCAQYGDYSSMFFDGQLVGETESREFFKGNNFYTTIANRVFREQDKSIVTVEDGKKWLLNFANCKS